MIIKRWTFAIVRKRYSQREKIAFVEEWIESGLTQQAYCKSKNISHDSFKNCLRAYRIKHRIPEKVRARDYFPRFVSVELENQEIEPIASTGASAMETAKLSIQTTRSVPEESGQAGTSYSEIQITYPTGTILRLGSQVGLDELRTLLTLL